MLCPATHPFHLPNFTLRISSHFPRSTHASRRRIVRSDRDSRYVNSAHPNQRPSLITPRLGPNRLPSKPQPQCTISAMSGLAQLDDCAARPHESSVPILGQNLERLANIRRSPRTHWAHLVSFEYHPGLARLLGDRTSLELGLKYTSGSEL